MLLFDFCLAIVMLFLVGLVMEGDGAFWYVAGRALLRARLARFTCTHLMLAV